MNITIQTFRQFGHTERLQLEIDKLQKLEALAADHWKKSQKRKNTQISFANITNRLLSPFSKPSVAQGSHHRRTESALAPSATNESLEKVNSASAYLNPSSSLEVNPSFKKGHRRVKSDIHDIATTLALSTESDESRPSSRPSSRVSTRDEEAEYDRLSLTSSPSRTPSPTPNPVFEISITVEIESGKMFFYHQLYDGDTTQDIKQKPYYSPKLTPRTDTINLSASAIFPRKLLGGRPSVTKEPDVTIFIPAVHFYSHYYSTVVVSGLRVTSSESRVGQAKSVNFRFSPTPSLPKKKGSLLFSVNIESLPAEMKLQPSLLEFMEQVIKPLKGNAESSISNDSDSAESDSEGGASSLQSPTTPATISFPVEVTIFFHVKPSMVTLSCQPYSRVECSIAVPDVNLCCSFVLFSPQLAENSASRLSSSSSSSVLSSNVRPFNNLCVSGAVQAFSFNIFNPSISSTARTDHSSTETKKEVIGLTLGLASVHVSRQAVKVMPSPGKDSYEKMKLSVVVDVASIVLGFDMRRLNDVTAFRKCWYRKSVAEYFMLGLHQKKPTSSSSSKASSKQKKTAIPEERATANPQKQQQEELTHAEIVCVANISDLSCTANVSTVMGNASVILNQLIVEACVDVKSSEVVYLNLDCVLYSAHMDARNGVIAGDLHLEHTNFDVMTNCESGTIPKHTCTAHMKLLEARVDFMMSSVVAATAKDISVDLHDDWNNILAQRGRSSQSNEYIQVECNMQWDQAKLVICRSTTASLEEIVKRLKEFVLQQKRRSERTFLLMWPETTPSTLSSVEEVDAASETNDTEEVKYHHWYWGTKASCSSLLEALGFTVATNNEHTVSFMGTIGITGNSVCLACLHGPTFRETEWAVFSLCNITASFSTQAIPSFIMSAHSHKVGWGLDNRRICLQNALLTLGNDKPKASSRFGSVFRVVNKGTMPPLTNQPLAQWVSFVCIDHYIHPDLPQNKLFKYTRKFSISAVFGIPSLKLEMVHEHFYPSKSLSLQSEAEQPIVANVVCSFITSFRDSIAITTTADHYFFLHNLVKGYVEAYSKTKKDNATTMAKVKGIEEPEVKIKRDFSTEKWQLDPHLVLLAGNSWTSGTVNIGWLLEMLGFQEAKTTIPKSIQCGVMDLLDNTISMMVKKLLSVSAKKKLA